MENTKVVIISGMSGAGKSVALSAMEDCGYYCIDHLPAEVLMSTLDCVKNKGIDKIAIGLDPWDTSFVKQAENKWAHAANLGFDVKLLVLEAREEVLIKRYSETRRKHPLAHFGHSLEEAIKLEFRHLKMVPRGAHRIDTSDLAPSTLKHWVKNFLDLQTPQLSIVLESFGFKHGAPLHADLMFDVRCLPNPYYNPDLRPLTGLDAPVQLFLEGEPRVTQMINSITDFVAEWIPDYEKDHRSYLTVGIGCTGGQHRSVYIAHAVGNELARQGIHVSLRHREQVRWPTQPVPSCDLPKVE